MSSLIGGGVEAFERDDDLDLVRDAVPGNIKLLEVMLESAPDNEQILALLEQLYASYTFGFLEADLERPGGSKPELKERINRFYRRGIEYGERALATASSRCDPKAMKVLAAFEGCLADLSPGDVPALYWYGFNLASYLNRNLNSMAALADAPKVEKVMERVIKLDERYNFGSAHLFLLVFYGGRSPMMGGNFDKAAKHYKAIEALNHSQFLLAKVLNARYVLVQKQDRKAFEAALKAVIDANPKPEIPAKMRLYNTLAKARAKLYLAGVEDFF